MARITLYGGALYRVPSVLWSLQKGYGKNLTNPTLEYNFCDGANPLECWPSQFGANFTFTFGDTTSNTVFFNLRPYPPSLSVTCTASEPLRWRVDCSSDTNELNSVQSIATFGGSGAGLTYRYELFLNTTYPGRIRCESYENKSRAAEIVMVLENRDPDYLYTNRYLLQFVALPSDDGAGLVIPCKLMRFHPKLDFKPMKVLKAPLWQILLYTPSDDCLSCFPQMSHLQSSDEPCTRCGPFGLQKSFWESANRPTPSSFSQLHSASGHSDDGSHCALSLLQQLIPPVVKLLCTHCPKKFSVEFIRCGMDWNCSARAIQSGPLKFTDCNSDGFITCSAYVTTLQAYPETCSSESEGASSNYIKAERCLFDLIGTEIDGQDASFDPRVGFRLKGDPDYEAVYMCTPG